MAPSLCFTGPFTFVCEPISPTSLARLMPREIHAHVNAGTSLVEYLREIDEWEAQDEK
jgi:hypothetical protein